MQIATCFLFHCDSPIEPDARIGKCPDRPQKDNLEIKMPVTHIKEIAAGLMTIALALPLVSAPAYTQPDTTSVLGLTVTGSPDLNAGMTVAIPVSGTDKPSIKPHRHQLHQKKNRS
jgi:hypothetical protein